MSNPRHSLAAMRFYVESSVDISDDASEGIKASLSHGNPNSERVWPTSVLSELQIGKAGEARTGIWVFRAWENEPRREVAHFGLGDGFGGVAKTKKWQSRAWKKRKKISCSTRLK